VKANLLWIIRAQEEQSLAAKTPIISILLAKTRHTLEAPEKVKPFNKKRSLVSRAGLEPARHTDPSQVIDSRKRQKRQNGSFRRFEVHGRYTGYELVSSGGAR
jgi:hypothetical protein